MEGTHLPQISKSHRIINPATFPHVLRKVLAKCDETECDTGAAGVPYRAKSGGLGGDLFAKKRIYRNGAPKNTTGNGVHEIVGGQHGFMHVTCSHITFVGSGKDQTTICGGFRVENQQHVKFEELAITNQANVGLWLMGSETNVDVLKCVVKECGNTGMSVRDGATVTATQCEIMENGFNGVSCVGANTKARLNDCTMHHNGYNGLQAYEHAVVDLHGTKTDIHSNKGRGIYVAARGKVNIHLPSQHNTSHGNVKEDRFQELRGFGEDRFQELRGYWRGI